MMNSRKKHCLTVSSPSFLPPPSILLLDQSISQMCLTIYHFSQLIFLLLTAVFFHSVSVVFNLLADASNTESESLLCCGGKNSLSFQTFYLWFLLPQSVCQFVNFLQINFKKEKREQGCALCAFYGSLQHMVWLLHTISSVYWNQTSAQSWGRDACTEEKPTLLVRRMHLILNNMRDFVINRLLDMCKYRNASLFKKVVVWRA